MKTDAIYESYVNKCKELDLRPNSRRNLLAEHRERHDDHVSIKQLSEARRKR